MPKHKVTLHRTPTPRTLPAHEQAARRSRAIVPSVSKRPQPTPHPAATHERKLLTNPLLHGQS